MFSQSKKPSQEDNTKRSSLKSRVNDSADKLDKVSET